MSYETINYFPKGISKRLIIEFAKLLGYRRSGTNAHLGSPDVAAMVYFEDKDYRSWQAVELSIGRDTKTGLNYAHTRTTTGRSHYDFAHQNRTVLEFQRRFGGRAKKDGGNGDGYDPGPPIPPAASGCYLATQRLDWNLTRITISLHLGLALPVPSPMQPAEKIWPQMRQLNPEIFVSNVLLTYLVSVMEDYFKSTYIALLAYSDKKASVLKGSRLTGEQLAQISQGTLSVEQALAENMPFQRLSAVGKHFSELDQKLDILAPLKKPYRGRKVSLLVRLEGLVSQRHNLIHNMEIDIDLDRKKLEDHVSDLTVGLSKIYQGLTEHYDWEFNLPGTSNFQIARRSARRSKI